MYLFACFNSSPTSRTTEVVPSPVMSSWAVAARAIMTCFVQYNTGEMTGLGGGTYGGGVLNLLGGSQSWSRTCGGWQRTISFSSTLPSFVSLICRRGLERVGWVTRADLRLQHRQPAWGVLVTSSVCSVQCCVGFLHLECTAGSQVGSKHLLRV